MLHVTVVAKRFYFNCNFFSLYFNFNFNDEMPRT